MENIKKFFKWIADHTGISWIARKISSGWKWLFSSKANTDPKNTSPKRPLDENVNKSPTVSTPMQNETEESVSKTNINVKLINNFPEKSEQPRRQVNPNKPNVIQQNTKPGSYFEFTDNKLLFFTTNENYKVLEEKCKNEDGNGKVIPGEFRIFVECESDKFCITGPYSSCQDIDYGKKSVSITSLRKQNDKGTISTDNSSEMRYKVGLDENKKLVKITKMSKKPFEITTPNPNATTAQQMVNNKEVTTETEKFYDAEEVETKTLSIVPIKKSQDNSIVINGVIIPEGAKLKFFPELSNFLSRASSEREKLFCKVVPSSLFIQPKTAEQIAGNDRSC